MKSLCALYGMGDGNIMESDAMFTARFLVRRIRRAERTKSQSIQQEIKQFLKLTKAGLEHCILLIDARCFEYTTTIRNEMELMSYTVTLR